MQAARSRGVGCAAAVVGVYRWCTCVLDAVAVELEAQIGIAEKTIAEFVIEVAKGARNVDAFKQVPPHAGCRGDTTALGC